MAYSPNPAAERVMKAAFQGGEKVVIIIDKSQEGSGILTTYVANAPSGTLTSAASWEIVRIIEKEDATFDAKTVDGTQIEYRSPMALDNYDDPTLDSLTAWEAVPWT